MKGTLFEDTDDLSIVISRAEFKKLEDESLEAKLLNSFLVPIENKRVLLQHDGSYNGNYISRHYIRDTYVTIINQSCYEELDQKRVVKRKGVDQKETTIEVR
jgi:hypothetical protein